MARMSLRAARVNACLSQKEAAARLGIGNKTLGSWENGVSFPRIDQVEKLCALYGCSYDDLVFLPDNPVLPDFSSAGGV